MFKVLLILAILFVGINAAPPAAPSGVHYNFSLERNIANGLLDTLSGSTDSITLFNRISLNNDYEYYVRFGTCTGTGTDSVWGQFVIDYFGNAGDTTLIRRDVVDTLVTANGQDIMLPVNRTAHAKYYTAKLLSSVKTTRKLAIINNVSLIARKTVLGKN